VSSNCVRTSTRVVNLLLIFLIPEYIYWLIVPHCSVFPFPIFHMFPLSLIRLLCPHPCCAESFPIPRVIFLISPFSLFVLLRSHTVSVLVITSPMLTIASVLLLFFYPCSKFIVLMSLPSSLFVPLRSHTVSILVITSPMLTIALVPLLSSYPCSILIVLMFVVMYATLVFNFPPNLQLSLIPGDLRFRTHNQC
jgi:hypothetical protein